MVTILVVEDDIGISEVIKAILAYKGYDVIITENGHEALQYLERGDLPDLILSDVMMPVMDGRELCRRIRATPSYSSIPLVLMSAALGPSSLDNCDYSAFISKPFEVSTLLSTLDRLLGERHAR
jgi:CheY-like chemotaxis protein